MPCAKPRLANRTVVKKLRTIWCWPRMKRELIGLHPRLAKLLLIVSAQKIQRTDRLRLVLCGPFLIVVVADVGDVHPSVRHLVDGSVAPSYPLIRIRVGR